MTKGKYFFLLASVAVLTVTGCKRNDLNNETTSSEDNASAEALWDDVEQQVIGTSSLEDPQGNILWNQCASVSVDTIETTSIFPLVFTVNFGEVNCECRDGRLRRGVLIYQMTGPLKDSGSVISVSTDDYYVNDTKVEGERIMTNLGTNALGQQRFSIEVNSALIQFESGETVSWTCERTRTWVEGAETGFFTKDTVNGGFLGWDGVTDDVYEITGSSTGINRDGRAFEASITSPLRVALNCKWITSGTIELTPEELLTRTVDYGDGNCDNKATIAVGSNEYQIELRQ